MKSKEKNYHGLTVSDDVLKIINEYFKIEREGNKDARLYAKKALNKFLIKTEDGSYTLKSGIVDGKSETMHTYHGAIEESLEKFVKPAKLRGKKNVHILDICSGLGYNAASCIEFLEKYNLEMKNNVKINIDMVEISKETLAAALIAPNPLKSHDIIKKAIEEKLYEEGFLVYKSLSGEIPKNIHIQIFCDDARQAIKKMDDEAYDAVFLDPFSPGKSPELYSLEFFIILYEKLKEDGVLSTYTSAAPVRSALIQAGFQVGEGPSFGRKKGGTVASLTLINIDKPLSTDDERMVALSDAGIPFRDPKLSDSRFVIKKRREKEREVVRGSEKLASTVKTPIYLYKTVDDPRTKKRVLKNLKEMGIDGLKSKKSRFIVCPQYNECICDCGVGRLKGSHQRVNEMKKRLSSILE